MGSATDIMLCSILRNLSINIYVPLGDVRIMMISWRRFHFAFNGRQVWWHTAELHILLHSLPPLDLPLLLAIVVKFYILVMLVHRMERLTKLYRVQLLSRCPCFVFKWQRTVYCISVEIARQLRVAERRRQALIRFHHRSEVHWSR